MSVLDIFKNFCNQINITFHAKQIQAHAAPWVADIKQKD